MRDKQEVRNALSEIEDAARQGRNRASDHQTAFALGLIARLAQIVREDIVQ